jgi:hypothetical protein
VHKRRREGRIPRAGVEFCFFPILLFGFALLCFALLCFALLCFALLCFALLCFALLCFARNGSALTRADTTRPRCGWVSRGRQQRKACSPAHRQASQPASQPYKWRRVRTWCVQALQALQDMVCVGRYNGRGLGGWWAGGCSLCSSTVRLFRTCRPTRPTVLGRGKYLSCRLVASSPRRLVALPRCHADDADTNPASRNHTHTRTHTRRYSCPVSYVCYDAAAVASLDAWPAAAQCSPSPPPLQPTTRRRCCHLQARPPRTAGRVLANCACTSSVPSSLLLPENWSVMCHVPCAMWAACRPSCELSTAQKTHSCAPCRSACARLPRARAMSVATDVPVPCCTLCRSA